MARDEMHSSYIKDINTKLKTILYSTSYCGLCLKENYLSSIESESKITINERTCCKPFKEVMDYVFRYTNIVPASSYVCKPCRDKILHSYSFIQSVIETTTVIEAYIDNFQNKVIDLTNEMDPLYDYSTINCLLILENGHHHTEIVMKIEEEKVRTSSRSTTERINHQTEIVRKSKEETITTSRSTTERKKDFQNELLIKNVRSLKNKPVKRKNLLRSRRKKIELPVVTMNGYECKECHTLLKTLEEWKIHKRTDHKPVCEVCSKMYERDSLLIAHYKIHNKVRCKICLIVISDTDHKQHLKNNHPSSIHSCEICDDVFYNNNALQVHIKIVHENSNPDNQCIMCMKQFSKYNLLTHKCKYKCSTCREMPCLHHEFLISYREQMLNHSIKIKCPHCNYICKNRSNLISHANREHLNYHPFTCDYCAMQFYAKGTLTSHIIKIHQETQKKMYICEFCDQEFNVKNGFDDHIQACMSVKRKLSCGQCSVSFDSLEKLNNHTSIQHGQFPCDLCPKKFNTEPDLIEHKSSRHRSVQIVKRLYNLECTICDKHFDTRGEYSKHMKQHGPNVKFPCKKCNIEFETVRKLHDHNRKHVRKNPQIDEKAESNFSFVCPVCGKVFKTKLALNLHSKSHTEHVKCTICQRNIKEGYMSRHLHLQHKRKLDPNAKPLKQPVRIRKYKCDQCNYAAFAQSNLESHINRHHLRIKPFVCDVCGNAYGGRGQMREHRKCHSESNKYPCPICKKKFLQKKGLAGHILIHTGESPYLCDICGKAFKHLGLMKEHRATHGGNKFVCPLCGEKFCKRRFWRNHIKKAHWKKKGEKFNPRDVKGLSVEHYRMFQDMRKVYVDDSG